jgi:hypothetical protein
MFEYRGEAFCVQDQSGADWITPTLFCATSVRADGDAGLVRATEYRRDFLSICRNDTDNPIFYLNVPGTADCGQIVNEFL